jgi:hypothetical protein
MFALLFELWRDFRDPAFLWQVLALGLSLLVAWALSRYWRKQEFASESTDHGALRVIGTGSLKRISFPCCRCCWSWSCASCSGTGNSGRSACSTWPCHCCSRWRWCGRRSTCCATPSRRGSWLATSERLIATSIWCWSRALSHRACQSADRDARTGELHVGKQNSICGPAQRPGDSSSPPSWWHSGFRA